ncbi:MAG: hypothetical protein Tsb0013_05280 [Phycisphaerales bacterium]
MLCTCGVIASTAPLISACGSSPKATGGTQNAVERESPAVIRESDWAIALRFFSGPGHREAAQRALAQVARETGRPDARVRTRERGSVIVAGRYSGPGDAGALAELERIQAIASGDARPYERSYLAPPVVDTGPGLGADELDLNGAKARFGEDRAVYTLEYATFDEGGPARYRRAAEEEAARLRSEGELAFYYHGRSNSTVTLGLFGIDAVDNNARFSPEVDFLQRRFKFLMQNGDRIPLGEGTYWPTRLVRVPG